MVKKSISNAHFVVFLSRRCQNVENRPWNLFPFKNVLFFDHRVRNVPQVSSETSLPWLVQNKPSAPIRRVENKVEFLERQCHSEKLSFVHKKETEHSFELSLSICVFYRRIFNLKMQNFSQWRPSHDEHAPAILLMGDIYYGIKSLSSHCQKLGTRWRLRVRTKAIMAANSYKKMYGDKEPYSNISIMCLRVFGARLETC